MVPNSNRLLIVVVLLVVAFVLVAIRQRFDSQRVLNRVEPVAINSLNAAVDGESRAATMKEVLELAQASLDSMISNVNDYTARFVKQEQDTSGVLGEETEMKIKVMPRHRDDRIDAPMRVYLQFLRPESQRGREVIWAEDLHDAQLIVHEAGLLGVMTLRLDPNGFIAMRGQRFPINNIGLTRLVELLIERGRVDVGNSDITVAITPGYEIDGINAELIQVRRAKPSGTKEDFSLAEIAFDRERLLILRYRSFGWPKTSSDSPPLIESYTYHDIQLNVGLTATDFDPANPEYHFP